MAVTAHIYGWTMMIISLDKVRSWLAPPFQRPIRENQRVLELAEQLKADGGSLESTITLGRWEGNLYIVDGQHRCRAFELSGLPEMLVYVVVVTFEDGAQGMIEMAKLHQRLNRVLVAQRPDDLLRSLEVLNPALQLIRKECPFVGYDYIRRSERSPLLSMAVVIKAWRAGGNEVPTCTTGAMENAQNMSLDDAAGLVRFLKLAFASWGREIENVRLWSVLNLNLCIWIYRRIVNANYSARAVKLDEELFGKCLMALSAESNYVEWLRMRKDTERDRSPGYNRIKAVFVRRIREVTHRSVVMPAPAWACHTTGR